MASPPLFSSRSLSRAALAGVVSAFASFAPSCGDTVGIGPGSTMANAGGAGGTATTSDASFAGTGGASPGVGGSGGGVPDGSVDLDATPSETGSDARPDAGDEA